MRRQLFDGQAIDLLLNNAGIIGPRGQTIGNIDYEAWAEVLAINTMGPMRVSEAFVEHVARSDRKLIVTLTSGGVYCRQYFWRLDRLSQLEGGSEHGHAQPGHRSCSLRPLAPAICSREAPCERSATTCCHFLVAGNLPSRMWPICPLQERRLFGQLAQFVRIESEMHHNTHRRCAHLASADDLDTLTEALKVRLSPNCRP